MGKATTDNDTAGARRDFFPGFNAQMIQTSGAIWTCNSSFGILWDINRTTHSLMWSTGFPGGDCPPVQRVYWSVALPGIRRSVFMVGRTRIHRKREEEIARASRSLRRC